MKILIVRVSAIGDVIHTLPCIFLLKKMLPQAKISWVVQKKAAALLQQQPFLENLWIVPDQFLAASSWPQTWPIVKEMRSTVWDAIIDFQGLLKTSLLITSLRGKKFGFDARNARWRLSSLFTHHHTTPTYTNIIQKNLALTSDVIWQLSHQKYCPTLDALKKEFRLTFPSTIQQNVNQWCIDHAIKKPILLCPNTTSSAKHWPLQRWQELCLLLINSPLINNNSIILLGSAFGKAAQDLATWIEQKQLPISCLPSWDLLSTAYVIKTSALIIAPDTGLLHVADFLGTPSLGIFGPTLAKRHGPFLNTSNQRNAIQIDCPHHYQKRHTDTKWSRSEQNCMLALKADTVQKKIVDILGL